MMDNNGCLGYVKLALQKLIDSGDLELELAEKIIGKVYVAFDFKTEKEARDYHCNNMLEQRQSTHKRE